ncbi:hypothetical protein [Gallaecimonas xiamenensis]|uniref:Uncharacterized protein n=1 Tax=Gallaecimonas xiamenensis 3-C-1 TaxID=745411 RepID=K2J3B3_9GAMM|nr:hypothetical protein [Gallaecimonas xiamenensis]EKE77506.1 hypothetical protein B3C1_01805 [Gallaecimonas xiamenensis 3-C-1]
MDATNPPSKLGLVAFVCALLALLSLLGVTAMTAYTVNYDPSLALVGSAFMLLAGVLALLGVLGILAGLGFGIGALIRDKGPKGFAISGFCLSFALSFLLLLVVVAGLAA